MITTNDTDADEFQTVYELQARINCSHPERAVAELATAQSATVTTDGYIDLRLQVMAADEQEAYRRAINLVEATLEAANITDLEVGSNSLFEVA